MKRVQECFDRDLEVAVNECVLLYGSNWDGFPGEVQEILVNMLFNMGRPRLGKFKKMNRALEYGDWKEAAVQGRDSLWHKQVGNRAERLMTRLENVLMNLFYLDEDLDKCAEYHVDKHVNKMILEAAQLLCTAIWVDQLLGFCTACS